MVRYLHGADPVPQLLKTLCIIRKRKGFGVTPIGASTVSHGGYLPNIDGNNHRFGIDYSLFFCFNSIHGLYSFPWFFDQLANWGIRKKEYSLF